jgi:hypothetical protein
MRRLTLPSLCVLATLTACSDDVAPTGDASVDTGADESVDVSVEDNAAPDVQNPPDAEPPPDDVIEDATTTEDVVDAPAPEDVVDAATPEDVFDAADSTSADAPAMDAPRVDAATDVARMDVLFGDVSRVDVAADTPRVDVPRTDAAADVVDASVTPATEWVGVVGTGQSLSIGASAGRVINNRQPYNNLKLADTGTAPLYDGMGDMLSAVPLVEPIRSGLTGAGYPGAPFYPTNIAGETPHTAMATEITELSRTLRGADYITAHSVVGESGRSITSIERMGVGRAYAATLYEARAFANLARAAGRRFTYGAIILTHGETDSARATYGDDIYRLFTDYNRDLRAITGQTTRIPMLISQQSTVPNTVGGRSISTLAVWRAGVDHPGEMICVGPKYQYEYAADRLHFDAYGYQRLGIKYAQVFYEVVVRGRAWRPLEPTAVRRMGRVITVDFRVPVAPLAWEETLGSPHQTAFMEWAQGRGFEVESSAGRQRIEGVRIVGTSVEVTLAAAPTGTNLVVRYAMTQDVNGYAGGLQTGRRGLLRDSDPFVGFDRAVIRARVTNGSATVTGVAANAFVARGVHDRVEGAGLAGATAVMARTDAMVTLSRSWTGATGEASLTFYSDQRNYAVQFEMAVP